MDIRRHIVDTSLRVFRIAQANKYQRFIDPSKGLFKLVLKFV